MTTTIAKVLSKGQITLPKIIREKLGIKAGDIVSFKEIGNGVIIKKGKSILDYKGCLPDTGLSAEKIKEKAVAEAVKEIVNAPTD
jgi:AbrB family looped-hinge helix DNA binding protein